MIGIGRISEIWRYPVKAMAGERVGSCRLGFTGLKGDRQWALRDEARQEIQSCKTRPQLLQCQAKYREAWQDDSNSGIEVHFADGSVMDDGHPEIDVRLSALVGRPSTLQALRPASDTAFYRRYKADNTTWLKELAATFERQRGEPTPDLNQLPPVLVEHVSVPGSLFLVAPIHIVTTASLHHLRQHYPAGDWEPCRFRPNLVIETYPEHEGLPEQGWIGRHLKLGEATVTLTGPTVRCGAVTRAQCGLGFDAGILRTVVRNADQNVGVYAEITGNGLLQTGAEVLLSSS